MEAKSLLELEGAWETLSATSVTLGSNFLEIQTEPVNLMNSGQGVSQIAFVSAIAWVIIICSSALLSNATLWAFGDNHFES